MPITLPGSKPITRLLLLASVSLLALSVANAAEFNWTGNGGDTSWGNPGNWEDAATGNSVMTGPGGASAMDAAAADAVNFPTGPLPGVVEIGDGDIYIAGLRVDGSSNFTTPGTVPGTPRNLRVGTVFYMGADVTLTLSEYFGLVLAGQLSNPGTNSRLVLNDQSYFALDGGKISGLDIELNDRSELLIYSQNAMTGGGLLVRDDAKVTVYDEKGLTDVGIEMRGNAMVAMQSISGTWGATTLTFNGSEGGTGGTFQLDGNSTWVQGISSVNGNAGIIENGGAANTVLNVDTSNGDSIYGGTVRDGGGAGWLGLIKQGDGTLTLTGTNTHTGLTQINRGGVVVNGNSRTSAHYAALNGWIGGSGTVGNLFVINSATVKPGNSIGTLTVNGNFTMRNDGIYEVEVAGVPACGSTVGKSDLINASGNLVLENNASVRVVDTGGAYSAGSRYTIVQYGGTRTGSFASLTAPTISPFLEFRLDYGTGEVYLDVIRTAVSVETAAETENQKAVAGAVAALPDASAVYAGIASSSAGAARAGFDQLSGEVHSVAKVSLIEDARFIREAILARLEDGRDTGLWASSFGAQGSAAGDGNGTGIDRRVMGGLAGMDSMVGDWRIGLLGGYGRSSTTLANGNGSAGGETYQAAIYAGTDGGVLRLRGAFGYGMGQFDTTRSVNLPGLGQTLTARYGTTTLQGMGDVSLDLDWAEPFANIAHVRGGTGAVSETGGSAALSGTSDTVEQTFATLGLRVATTVEAGDASATLRGALAWRRTLGDTRQTSDLALAGAPGFTTASAASAADAALVEAGIDLGLSDAATLGVSYSGLFSPTSTEQSLKGALAIKF